MSQAAGVIFFLTLLAVLSALPRRVACRLVQALLTFFFAGGAIVGLTMTTLGQVNSVSGGLLFSVGAATLAFASYHLFGWAARRV